MRHRGQYPRSSVSIPRTSSTASPRRRHRVTPRATFSPVCGELGPRVLQNSKPRSARRGLLVSFLGSLKAAERGWAGQSFLAQLVLIDACPTVVLEPQREDGTAVGQITKCSDIGRRGLLHLQITKGQNNGMQFKASNGRRA